MLLLYYWLIWQINHSILRILRFYYHLSQTICQSSNSFWRRLEIRMKGGNNQLHHTGQHNVSSKLSALLGSIARDESSIKSRDPRPLRVVLLSCPWCTSWAGVQNRRSGDIHPGTLNSMLLKGRRMLTLQNRAVLWLWNLFSREALYPLRVKTKDCQRMEMTFPPHHHVIESSHDSGLQANGLVEGRDPSGWMREVSNTSIWRLLLRSMTLQHIPTYLTLSLIDDHRSKCRVLLLLYPSHRSLVPQCSAARRMGCGILDAWALNRILELSH